MRQFFHLPYEAHLDCEELAQMMAATFPDKKVTNKNGKVTIRYRSLVRGQLRILRNDRQQMTTISYGTRMPAGLGWWSWLLGVLPAIVIWVIYMGQKGTMIDQITTTLRTQLSHRFAQPSPFFPTDEERQRWHNGAAMWLRWIGVFSFVVFVLNQLAIPLRMYISTHYNIHMLSEFTHTTSLVNHILSVVIGLAIGFALIVLGKGSRSGRWAGILKVIQTVWGIAVFFLSFLIVRSATVSEIQASAATGYFSWWSILFFLIGSSLSLTIGILLWRSLRTGPGRYLLLAVIWGIGLNLYSMLFNYLILPNTQSPQLFVLNSISMFALGCIHAVLLLKAWFLMPKYMRVPK